MAACGDSFTYSCHAVAKFAQRRTPPVYPPRLRQFGGSPCASCRPLAANFRNPAALLPLPAPHPGNNFLNHVTKKSILLLAFTEHLALSFTQYPALSPKSVVLCTDRQHHREHASLPDFALHTQVATVRLAHRPRYEQPLSQPARIKQLAAGRPGFAPVEAVKNMR